MTHPRGLLVTETLLLIVPLAVALLQLFVAGLAEVVALGSERLAHIEGLLHHHLARAH